MCKIIKNIEKYCCNEMKPRTSQFLYLRKLLFLFFRNLQKNGLATQLVKVKLLSQLKNNIKEQHNMERRIISTKPNAT